MCASSSESQATSWQSLPVGPLGASAAAGGTYRPASLRPRGRRPPRVLYPPLVRRVLPREEPDSARRWLLLLSALLFLQIYTEESSCGPPELQLHTPETSLSTSFPQEGEGITDIARLWGGPERDSALEATVECAV
ncbi:radiation-inducible immediate-early gene IEX-1 [Salmo salar]|uniref:Radiation-inducible immediate-early gene IEX-1 n=1 Tax=Salmo salar TaxID=8030 RepID=A0A1S3PKA9_SALSA|nr:radiation-inducible immediate-early gene IEX-1 [Salmo salar]|eukprot:XP_014028082.1 PREDICTED: radiation-inducible immediate-early gene IEX-1 [Salmo salar]